MSSTLISREKASELHIYPERLDLLHKKLSQWVDEGLRQSIAVRIMRNGQSIFEGAYGSSKPKPDTTPLTLDHIFPVASITKPIIATLLMQLQEDGEIDLCEWVSEFVPSFKHDNKNGISIWHLLTHTSGLIDADIESGVNAYLRDELKFTLPENNNDDGWDKIFIKARNLMELPEIIDTREAVHDTWATIARGLPPTHQPHKLMSYCNTGYQLCKEIVTNVYGKPIEEIAQERIFKPLGMKDSHFILPKDKWDKVVRRGEDCEGYPWQNDEGCFISESGAGGLKTTTGDIIRFCEMIRSNGTLNGIRVLSTLSVQRMSQDFNYDLNAAFDSWTLGFNYRGKKFDDSGILRPSSCLDHGGWGGSKIFIDEKSGLSMAFFAVHYNGKKSLLAPFANIVYSCLSK